MLGFLTGCWQARAARPLLLWVLAVLVYVMFPLPQQWVLVLIVGLGVALAVTARRLREDRDQLGETTGRAWSLAERLAGAVEDRIRGGHDARTQVFQSEPEHEHVQQAASIYGQVGSGVVAYHPGMLLSAVVAVLAAEGLTTDAGPALPAVGQLLADLGITPHPGAPALTALGLTEALSPGAPRRARVMPAALLASAVRVILTQDQVLPEQINTDTAEILIADSAAILTALRVSPGDAGSLADWPVAAEIIDALPLPTPYEQWDR